MNRGFRLRRDALAAGTLAMALPWLFGSNASAKDAYPARPVRVVLPFGAGSVTDGVTRVICARLTKQLGQPFVVENKVGANGSIGASQIARSPADGYHLLFTTNTTQSIIGSLLKNVPYDAQRDFTPIAKVVGMPAMLVVNPSLPIKSMEDFVAYGKANPGKLRYGHGNSSSQIGGESLQRRLGIAMLAVPYKSNPQAAQDVVAGNVEAMVVDVTTGSPLVAGGRLRALAVLTDKRIESMPNIPTVRESVSPAFDDITAWLGVFGPADLPPSIVELLAREIKSALDDPAIAAQLKANGVIPSYLGPSAFRPFLDAEQVRWTRLAKNAGITPE